MITNVMERLIDFTRTSGGGYFGPDGLFRFTPASRNLLTFTQELDNGAWVKGNATVTANAVAAPDGTLTADAVLPTATTAAHNVQQAGGGSGTPLTLSVYAKAGSHAFMQFSHGSASTIYANFNLLTGEVGTVGANATASITPAGDGWYRCTMTFTPGSAANLAIGHITSTTAGHRESWAATGTESIYLWGAQLELASAATDYTRNFGGLYPPRFDYDPVTLAPRGLLIEEQRTNLLLRSEEFESAIWAKASATITVNAAVPPDGTANADKLVEAAANAAHYMFQDIGSAVPDNTTFTTSIYVKAAGRTEVRIEGRRKDGLFWAANFDLAAGTLVASANVVGTPTIEPAGNGWFRISASATSSAGASTLTFVVMLHSGGARAYLGDGTSGLYLWGAQVEVGAFPTSYIPTVASQVTRTADVAVITGANFSRWYNQTEGTFVVEASVYDTASITENRIAASDGTTNNRIQSNLGADNHLFVGSGGVAQAKIDAGSFPSGIGKLAAAYKVNDFAAVISGGSVVTDTSGTVPTGLDRLGLGNLNGAVTLNGHIRRIRYYPTRLSDTQLQALTA